MKAFFSSPAPKFNQWMTVFSLGVTLLSLPMTALAQDFAPDTDTAIPSAESVSVSHQKYGKIHVNHTKWMVKYADNGKYHPVPWVFSPNGTVRAGNLWQGEWHRKSKDTIRVFIRMNNSSTTDQFDVQFTSSSKFTAYKNGQAYRFAIRK